MEADNGLHFPRKSNCAPDSVAILNEGSTHLFYMSFFSDSTGTVMSSICRDRKFIVADIELIKRRKMGWDTNIYAQHEQIHSFRSLNDSTFAFSVSENKGKIIEESYNCRIMKNGNIAVTYKLACHKYPDQPYSYREYKFIPFNNIPDNIGIIDRERKRK